MTPRLIFTLLLLTGSIDCSRGDEPDPMTERGRALVKEFCADCHAIDSADQSPHVGAPALHTLGDRLDLDRFVDRLREELTSGHPDMPTFRFTREDARALVAYLRSIQMP
jgi:cytochrome c